MKKIALGVAIVMVLLLAGATVLAKKVLTGESVRLALAAQIEKAIGQPVSIGTVSATIMPRVTVTLGKVAIGRPERVTVGELQVGTDLRALLSRRIEHASLRLTGARIELPLPAFTIAAGAAPHTSAAPSTPPVELVSIDQIVLNNVEVVSGGRTLRGDIEVVPQGKGLAIRKISLGAGETTITVTGQITDFTGPVGELALKAGALDMDQLLAFVSDFTAGAGATDTGVSAGTPATGSSPAKGAEPAAESLPA